MSVFSASQDFESRTLAAIPGLWGKVLYVSSLRRPDGRYEHWGLSRRFGEETAQQAISRVHYELVFATLRMPLRDLLARTKEEAAQGDVPLMEFLARLKGNGQLLLPNNFQAGSTRHFTAILQSLESLARACTDASRQAS